MSLQSRWSAGRVRCGILLLQPLAAIVQRRQAKPPERDGHRLVRPGQVKRDSRPDLANLDRLALVPWRDRPGTDPECVARLRGPIADERHRSRAGDMRSERKGRKSGTAKVAAFADNRYRSIHPAGALSDLGT